MAKESKTQETTIVKATPKRSTAKRTNNREVP